MHTPRNRRLLLSAALVGLSGAFAHADLIVDGSFENPAHTSGYYYNPTGGAWTFAIQSGEIVTPSGFNSPNPTNGNQLAFLQTNGGSGVISQTVNFPSSGIYTFSINHASREGNPIASYEVQIDGVNVGGTRFASTTGFKANNFTFKAPAGSHTVSLVSTGPVAGDSTTFLDEASINSAASQTAGVFTQRKFTGDADSGISSAKTYTHAVNFGRSNTVINGVSFINGANGDQTGTAGYNLSGAGNAYGANPNNLTGSSNELGTDFYYGGPASLTLTGLTPGTTYTTTFYGIGFGPAGGRFTDITDSQGGSSLGFDENAAGSGNGVLLQDTFTATGSSISFNFNPQNLGDTFHHYAFTNEVVAVPEPTSLAFLGLASVSLLASRRRNR